MSNKLQNSGKRKRIIVLSVFILVVVAVSVFFAYVFKDELWKKDDQDTFLPTTSSVYVVPVAQTVEIEQGTSIRFVTMLPGQWNAELTEIFFWDYSTESTGYLALAGSSYEMNGIQSEIHVNILKKKYYESADRAVGGVERTYGTIGEKNVVSNGGYESIVEPYAGFEGNWNIGPSFELRIVWEEPSMPDYFFYAVCSGGIDDKEALTYVCKKAVESFEVEVL